MGVFDYLRNMLLDHGFQIRLSFRFGSPKVTKHSEINWARFIELGKKLVGKPYNFGVEVNLKESNPDNLPALDCSELIEWIYAQVGISVPDGSYNQFKVSKSFFGDPLIGDLGFKWIPETQSIHHVGVWLGDSVLEAKGKLWGVVLTPRSEFEHSSHFAMWKRLQSIVDA